MARILFVPTESREIAQFSLVKPELEALGHEVVAIALDKGKALDHREALESLLQEKGFRCKPITGYKTKNILKIINKEKPDIIVTDWAGFTPNSFIYAANYLGIPSLQINDGITGNYFVAKNVPGIRESLLKIVKRAVRLALFRANPRPLAYLFTTLIATGSLLQFVRKMSRELIKSTYPVPSYTEGLNIAVISPFAKDAHITMGAPADKIFVTGQPRFDLIRQVKIDRAHIMAKLGVPGNSDIIVLATQPVGELRTEKNRGELIEAVLSAMIEFQEKQLVIKLHPSEKLEKYQEMLTKVNSNAIICQDIDLYGLLRECDLLMAVYSTVALEAMILDKPVIIINLTGKPDIMPYAKSGAALGVYQKEDLAPAIRKALYDLEVRRELEQNRKSFVAEHVYKVDGQSSKRVAELIVRLIGESKTRKGVIA